MTPRGRFARARWLGGALIVAGPLVLLGGCPAESGPSGGTGGAAGGGTGGATPDGSGGEPWDPVWHETAPKDWPVVGPENNPDCGPGCRVALNVPMTNAATYGHRCTTSWIASESPLGIAFTSVGGTQTSIVPHEPGFLGQLGLWGDHVSHVRSFGIADGQIELTSLITGETKLIFRYEPPDSGKSSSELTALNAKHAFFIYKGFNVRNLETGSLTRLGSGACYSLCATETAFVCESGKIYVIDPVTGDKERLDDGTELQFDGNCSPDRKQYVWVDYRDPPGPGSAAFSDRSGGEIYLHDFTAGETRRVTFDSPAAPRAKIYPAVGDGLVVWNEPPASEPNQNPSEYGNIYALTTALATLDLTTGKRCRSSSAVPTPLGRRSVHGRHVYSGWLDKQANQTRLVDIDLDHPAFEWQCVMTPGWGS